VAADPPGLHARGRVAILPCASPEAIEARRMHPELNVFRPPERQKEALAEIAKSPDGCVTLGVKDDLIVGYAAFHRPDAFERWAADETGGLYELGAVEVAPDCRGQGLARRLLAETFATGRFEDKVVLATLYYWHYDLKRTGLSPFAYRELLEKLYRSVGFETYATDDPDIFAHAENALMARIGKKAPEAVIKRFHELRFAHDEGPWCFI